MGDDLVVATVAAGVRWIYETEQPDDSLIQHHGITRTIGDVSYSFCPTGAAGAPVVSIQTQTWVDYPGSGKDRRPVTTDEAIAVFRAIASTAYQVREVWNGPPFCTMSWGMRGMANDSLRRAVARDHAGCPVHRPRLHCSWDTPPCPWFPDGVSRIVQPAWPDVEAVA